MSSGAALMSMFGPMLEIGARVLLAIASGLLALVALRISACAICQGDAGVFLVGWALGIVGVCGAWIGFASLPLYRSSLMLQGVPDPMSGVGFWRFVQACEAPIALAIGSGVLIALCLRCGGGVGAAAGSSRDREARSRRIGAVGEARVAAELKRIGLPALHNVGVGGFLGRPAGADLRLRRLGRPSLHRRSRTRSFPFDVYGGCFRLSLPSRVRAFSMRRGGGSRARRRKALAAVRRTRLTRAGGVTRSEFGVRGDYLCA
jgi:hypothetical protein